MLDRVLCAARVWLIRSLFAAINSISKQPAAASPMAVPRQDTVTLELAPGLRQKLLCCGHQTVGGLDGCQPEDLQAGQTTGCLLKAGCCVPWPWIVGAAH